jgi:hypothetical protein
MTSNLRLARQAVAAELKLAKQGMDYYLSQVEALEQALAGLEGVGAEQREPAPRQNNKRANGGLRSQAESGARKAREFPTTGGDFWLTLITNQPRSAAEIANAAAASLGFAEERSHVRILKQRVSPALNALVDAQKIKDSGAGRERRFFKE